MSLAFNKFNAFVADISNKVHNLGSDTLKLMLSNVLPLAANAVYADITEIANGNGYLTGGAAITGVTSTQTGGLYTLKGTGPSWTASGGSMATFRYIVMYNSTPGSKNLIGWWDNGAGLVLTVGETFATAFDASAGALQLQ